MDKIKNLLRPYTVKNDASTLQDQLQGVKQRNADLETQLKAAKERNAYLEKQNGTQKVEHQKAITVDCQKKEE